jgi:hypothetical protein
MTLALSFGFLHLFIPIHEYSFERLHIFLFNLCTGGTLLLYFTENQRKLSTKSSIFLLLALLYAVLAFFKRYIPAMIISLILAGIVESTRIKRFSFLPFNLFSRHETVSNKFHVAALMCLSSALVFSAFVVLNKEYVNMFAMPKLQLNTFFLGFSFPISLITMSVIFAMMDKQVGSLAKALKEIDFWVITAGVVVFFLFIIFETLLPQLIIAFILFIAVVVILALYYRLGEEVQQKNFLTSGIYFLMVAGLSGIAYIIAKFTSDYSSEKYLWLLRIHTFASLYGWNLCGLAVICRFNDFPIKLHSKKMIILHWLTVIVLAPLGLYYPIVAFLATVAFVVFLSNMLFSQKNCGKCS